MLGPMYGLVAALLTRMSTPPNAAIVASTHACACSGSPALAANVATSPSMAAAASSSASCLRDDSITRAPDAANADAIARPMPFDAPVTSATFRPAERPWRVKLEQ